LRVFENKSKNSWDSELTVLGRFSDLVSNFFNLVIFIGKKNENNCANSRKNVNNKKHLPKN
jgi:hypothetical protein